MNLPQLDNLKAFSMVRDIGVVASHRNTQGKTIRNPVIDRCGLKQWPATGDNAQLG